MAGLELERVSKTFGTSRVLNDVSLSVRDGEFLTLVGASGCGKSTILRVIAGLEPQDEGTVRIGSREVDALRPKQRNVAMVFQSYALYPHMSVEENISMPLVMQRFNLLERMPGIGRLSPRRSKVMADIGNDVQGVARQLQIEALLKRKPAQLSGGQRQRVALGRAMVRRPDVFLMDEPLSNLDAKLRVHMRAELSELHKRLGVTFIYVTHDQTEAMTMADRVALMDEGRIVQLGTPSELYHNPADLRVARFIGSPPINVIKGIGVGNGISVDGLNSNLPFEVPVGTQVQVGIRPEAISIGPKSGRTSMKARVAFTENLGAEVFLHFQPIAASTLPLVVRTSVQDYEAHKASFAEDVVLSIESSRAMIFDQAGKRLNASPSQPSAQSPAVSRQRRSSLKEVA
jgi:multiple sugar transport system ATP-binding protein